MQAENEEKRLQHRGALFAGAQVILLVLASAPCVGAGANHQSADKGSVDFPISIDVWQTGNPAFVVSGSTVTFKLAVHNTSAQDSITLTDLEGDIFGDLNGQGNCTVPLFIAPGNAYACTYPRTLVGAADSFHTNSVTVTANDARNRITSASASTSIGLVSAPVAIGTAELSNVVQSGAIVEPGGIVSVRIDIFNTGSADVFIDSLIDDVFGDLNGQGSCRMPQIVPVNPDSGFYTCRYQARITGPGGSVHSNTVTAIGSDSSGNLISSSDTSTVLILSAPAGANTASPIPALGWSGLLVAGLLVFGIGAADIARRQVR